jgi:glyoxylase-like metal-dependent hydrolase (beta-lactamase superfamily II)
MDLPEADPWFVVDRVGDGVALVTEPHVHPFLRCNVWHVQGRDRDLVVDTALGLAPLRGVVPVVEGRDVLAVATHVHGDHVGGMHEFEHRAIHEAEVDELAAPGIVCVDISLYGDGDIGPYRDAGYEFGDLLIDAVPPGGLVAAVLERDGAPPTEILREGDVVDLGDRAFEVLHLPGHSPGSIGLWEQATGVLFSGDAVYDGPLLDEIDGAEVQAYVATMRRLEQLPVTVVHGGHETSFGRDRLQTLCAGYLNRRTGTKGVVAADAASVRLTDPGDDLYSTGVIWDAE